VSDFEQHTAIIALMPKNMPDIPGIQKPTPSVEHTPMDCSLCDAPCWIGPAQLRMLTQNPARVRALCYMCIHRIGLADAPVVALDPEADEKPRMQT
jgi:hypothetical protein